MSVMRQCRPMSAPLGAVKVAVAPHAQVLRPLLRLRCAVAVRAASAGAEQAPPAPASAVQKLVTFPYTGIDQGKLDGCRTGQVIVDNKVTANVVWGAWGGGRGGGGGEKVGRGEHTRLGHERWRELLILGWGGSYQLGGRVAHPGLGGRAVGRLRRGGGGPGRAR